jgi:hypothetical protein
MSPRRIVFNRYQPREFIDEDRVQYIYSNDPIIQLDEVRPDEREPFPRHQIQRDAIPKYQPVEDPMFGSSLEWAYRQYIVHRLWAPDERDDPSKTGFAPLGNRPTTPVDVYTRRQQLQSVRVVNRTPQADDQRLYLFNVIVALEWIPSPQYMQQLEWAFRRASDLLYDVTNGCMAFGQVVFGDSDWMDCADIQIMASNRLLPRSWVSGLLDEKKYTPIRVGRGVWDRKRQVTIPWDEEEAYGTLIHEWSHYALEQRDAYLDALKVILTGKKEPVLRQVEEGNDPLPNAALYTIIVPKQRQTSNSIMATPEGNSELSNPLVIENEQRYYPNLNMPPGQFAGPGRLPLPLPQFQRRGLLAQGRHNECLLDVPRRVKDESAWVYVLHGNTHEAPERIIAQGTLDARSRKEGFELLGAEKSDTIILIEDDEGQLKVWRGSIDRIDAGNSAHIQSWDDVTPKSTFMIDVQPGKVPDQAREAQLGGSAYPVPDRPREDQRRAAIKLNIHNGKGQLKGNLKVRVFPYGKAADPEEVRRNLSAEASKSDTHIDVPTLDGHVMVSLGKTLLISTYSQGGSPATTPHVPTNPITAGAANGEVLLFFRSQKDDDTDIKDRYAKVRVVTTTLYSIPNEIAGAHVRSSAFSIASNEPLPKHLSPTLFILNDIATTPADGDLLIFRLGKDNQWIPLPTYADPGNSFAATPLAAPLDEAANDGEQAGGTLLVADDELGSQERVEHFQLYWKPHDVSGGKGAARTSQAGKRSGAKGK